MSRSEKFQPIATFFASFGFPPHPTGECGCGYCCNGIKKREKRADHKADRRTIPHIIQWEIEADDATRDITEEIDSWPFGPIEYPA